MFKRKKIVQIKYSEMVKLLEYIKTSCSEIYYREKREDEEFKQNVYIDIKKTFLEISLKIGSSAATYKFNLSEEDQKHYKSGLDAYLIFNKYAKVEKYEYPERIGSAKALLYKNEAYSGKRVKAYCYDLNSAYASALLQPIPDIKTLREDDYTKKDEIGFRETSGGELKAVFKEGIYCEYICKLKPSPYKKFVDVWYNKKKNAKNKKDKSIAKDILNFPIGYCQNVNPFLRCCVVSRCNEYITSLIDENTIYSNTDSLVSLVRRPDIEKNLGKEVGQWKLEHENEEFAWAKDKINYQWNLETPVVRGIPKAWFSTFNKVHQRPFDILIDNLPNNGNFYAFNKEKFRLERVKYEKEK